MNRPVPRTPPRAARRSPARASRRTHRPALGLTMAFLVAGSAVLGTAAASADGLPAAPRPDPAVLAACTGSSPMICHLDLAPGQYDVTVELESRTGHASTLIEAEARRLMVDEVRTAPGERIRRTFTVDVRAQEGQQNDHGAGRGTPGLTLTIGGASPAVAGIGVAPAAPDQPRLFLFGDSTVTDQEGAPYTGWGQRLPARFPHGLGVVNHSGSGESTSSFLADPRMWEAASKQLRPGDVALVQLAHNDKEITAEQYRANLATLVAGVRAKGAEPVLVTPIVRHRFDASGQLTDVGLIASAPAGDLPQHIREVAAEQDVPLIDLTARTEQIVEELGPVDSEPLYLIRENGDRTHTSEHGASVYAELVAQELRETGLVPELYWRTR